MSYSSIPSIEEVRSELLAGARRLSNRVRHWVWWRGVALWLGSVLAALAVLLLVDWFLRREEVGLRVLSLGVLVGTALLMGAKLLRPAWRVSPTPLQLAEWIERTRPELGGRLSTAVQIAETSPNELRFGSRGFRDAVLRDWSTEAHRVNWGAYIDTASTWRAIATAGLVAILLAAAFAIRPHDSQLALTRLFIPLSSQPWPRRDQLEFKDLPAIVGIGSELQLEVVDRNPPLPAEVIIQLRESEGAERKSILDIATRQLENVAVGNLPAVERAVEVRAIGGDDRQMPWRPLLVVKPPQLASYQFEIEPPAYAARPARELVGTKIQVLAGSRVRFSGRFDEPVKAMHVLMATDTEDDATPEWVPSLAPDAQDFIVAATNGEPQQLTQSIAWRLRLETRAGLIIELPQRWSIEVVDDAPPTVSMDAPEMSQVVANGELVLRGQAVDDLALATVTARLQVEGKESSEPLSNVIWTNSDSPTQEVSVDARWDLSSTLNEIGSQLSQGQVISIWLEARDHLGQLGRSQIERLEIQSAEQVMTRIVDRQDELLERMRELLDAQRRNQQLTEQTEQHLTSEKQITRAVVDALAGISQNQTAISDQLAGQRASLLQLVTGIESLLEMNRLEESPLAEQVDALRQSVSEIADGAMRQATAEATAAHRRVQAELAEGDPPGDESLNQVAKARQAQSQVVDQLQALADRVNRSGGLQQIQREFSEIERQQQALIRDGESLQLEQLRNRRPDAIEASQRAVAAEQLALAQQLDDLLARAHELSSAGEDDSSGIVEKLNQAAKAVVDGQAARLMRQAAERVAEGQFSSAGESQQQAAQVLAQALRGLDHSNSPSRAADLDNLAADLQSASESLSELAKSQSQLAEQMRQDGAAESAAELAEEQAALGGQTEQQASDARAAGETQAAAEMEAAAMEQRTAQAAAQQQQMDDAATAAEQAAQQLERLAEELQQRAADAERQSQQQQLYRLETALGQLLEQQLPIVDDLNKLVQERSGAGEVSSEAEARQLAAEQESVRLELHEVRLQIQKLPTFEWLLEQVAGDMARAVAAAQRNRLDPEAVGAATAALNKLQLATDAMTSKPSSPPQAVEAGEEEQAGSSGNEKKTTLPPLASLKLLRGLQDDLNQQALALESETNLTRRNRQLRELTDQQESLSKQLETLLGEIASAREELPMDIDEGDRP